MEQYTYHIYTKECTLLVFGVWIQTKKKPTIKILITILPNRSKFHNFYVEIALLLPKPITMLTSNIKSQTLIRSVFLLMFLKIKKVSVLHALGF
jgi:hypothetical protein